MALLGDLLLTLIPHRRWQAPYRQAEAIFATSLGSEPDGPVTAQPGGEGR